MANEPRAQGQQGGLAVEYMTVKDAAQRWNVTERLVQRLCAAKAFIAQAASVLLHLPAPEGLPHAQDVLPPGLRAFA